jgi:hypothetical protein
MPTPSFVMFTFVGPEEEGDGRMGSNSAGESSMSLKADHEDGNQGDQGWMPCGPVTSTVVVLRP